MRIIARDCYLCTYIVKKDNVTNAARCWLWFNTEEYSCEEWVIMVTELFAVPLENENYFTYKIIIT